MKKMTKPLTSIFITLNFIVIASGLENVMLPIHKVPFLKHFNQVQCPVIKLLQYSTSAELCWKIFTLLLFDDIFINLLCRSIKKVSKVIELHKVIVWYTLCKINKRNVRALGVQNNLNMLLLPQQ